MAILFKTRAKSGQQHRKMSLTTAVRI